MCRLFGLIADQPVAITFAMLHAAASLSRQSLAHPDGWGIGYYAGETAVLHKSPERAHGSAAFRAVAEQAASALFVAHVRSRTAGAISLANTHPFVAHGWMLAQNGGLGGAWHKRIKAEVGGRPIAGPTSGEHLLHWLYARAGHLAGPARSGAIAGALRELVAAPAGITSANFVLATGDCLYAFRFAPVPDHARALFYLAQPAASAAPGAPRTVQITSEPLTAAAWREVANGGLLVVPRDLAVRWVEIHA